MKDIWSINYPGWFTLPLLLWATISWMQNTSRTYFICVMIYAIILLFFEYFSTVVGQNLTELAINFDVQTVDNPLKFSMAMLIKTLLILLIWISLYQIKFSNYEEVRIKSFNWIAPIYDYIACLMTFIVVITMMGFGFIGHEVLTLIRLGYIVLAFVFLFSFQISLTFWRKTITYFWNMTIFYSIVVTTIIHICQFQGLSDFLKNKLQKIIGLSVLTGVDKFRIIIPVFLSITILIYLNYYHERFLKSTDINRKRETLALRIHTDAIQESKNINIFELTVYLHLFKVLLVLIFISILTDPCLLTAILMILVLLWFLLDYKSMTNVIFLFVVFIILLRTTYQLDYFEHGKWNINIENDGKILNLTEIIGLQKWSNAFMFVKSTSNMILIIFIMVVWKIIEIHLQFKYYPEKIPSVVFYHISAQQMNDGLLEWLMCTINEGFTYFGVEITLMWVVILVATNIDGFSIIYVLWIAIFAYLGYEKSSKYWSIFVAFVYFTIVFKYLLLFKTLIDIKFDENLLNKIGPLSNILSIISVLDHKSLIKRLCGLDFVVFYFVSQQSLIFKTKNKPINELIDTKSEELPDNLMTKRENFNVLKQNILHIYANFVMLVVFLNGVCDPDKIALGYLYTSYLFFSKGPTFYLQLYSNIINFWFGLWYYTISIIMCKVFYVTFICKFLINQQWLTKHLNFLMILFCNHNNNSTFNRELSTLSNTHHQGIELQWDVLLFVLLLFQIRVVKSSNIKMMMDDMKISRVLAQIIAKLGDKFRLGREDNYHLNKLTYLEKVKKKLIVLKNLQNKSVKREESHFLACLSGEYMFQDIFDDVHLVCPINSDDYELWPGDNSEKKFGKMVYRYYIACILYLVKKLNKVSETHRKTMQILEKSRNKLLVTSDINLLGEHAGPSKLWRPFPNTLFDDNFISFDDFDNNVNKHRHWFIQLIVALRDAIISCSDLLCYFAAFIYTTVNLYDYISITLLVVMIFWGLLSVPRESKIFWVVLIMYMQGVILLKHFCNISYLPWIEEQSRLVNGSMGGNLMFYPTINIGVANYKNTFYVDLIVLLFLYIHRAKLMKIGLWIQNDNLTNIRIKISPTHENRLLKSIRLFCEIPMINFSNGLYRNHMVKSVDVYPYMFLLIVFLMIFNLIIWHDAVESVKLSRISSKIIYEIIVHFIMLLLDRWFYVRQNKLGKLIFHIIFTTNFFYVLIELADMFEYNYFVLWATIEFVYIMLSAYQIRAGYSSRNIGSFIWHHYSILNLIIFKVYYYCPFVYELRLVFDWIWTDSTLTMSEWFKMEDIFVHICTVKCINRLRFLLDNPRGKKISRTTKIVFGGLVAIIILSVIIFPILWFSLPEGIPDTPKHVTMHIRFYRDTTILTTKSADIYSLDTLDFAALKEVYKNQLSHFLDGYRYNEISSVSIKLESSTAWFVTPHTFNTVLNKLQDSKWFISHENGLTISHGSNIIPLFWDVRQEILGCISRSINHTKKQNYNDLCKGVYIKHVLPKFLVTHLKSTEAKVIPKFMQHDQENPYMDVILKFLCDKDAKKSYWWGLSEVCPESDKGNYLKEIPHSSCIRNETKSSKGFNSYNIYIFSDRRSNLFGNFDSEGVFGLYTAVIVYFGFKVAHDLFRSFKFKLIYTEMTYPDRILQLCQEIYLVRSFGEWEMEEDLYAMLIYLFKSPETLLKFTKMPN